MKNLDINGIIDLCKQSNTDAFKYIVSEYQQLIYTLAFRILCNETDAEDATQETFIKIWQNIKQYKQHCKFSTWIYKITTHVCYDKLRSKQNIKNEELTGYDAFTEENQEELLHNKELKKLIIKLSSGLSPKQRLIFILSDIEDLKPEEIIVITGMSAAKIKSNLYLARKHIKSKIIKL